ncbi:MAG TPA: ClpXP protease specificity-enhancing factor [Gammaproteobacteria bacterium]
MTSSRPYLLRALYDWIIDNGMTPHLLVDAEYPGCEVPRQYVADGRIVFNVNPAAVNGLSLGNDYVLFDARFGGTPMNVTIPLLAVLAIYARENGRGMVFNEEEPGSEPPPEPEGPAPKPSRPSLRVVK